uniref:Uncharacterized protein n=1 Tax=Heterorhabditis bacteriophora TaxID=37862 RepID=A0A1I7XL04_HETBA
MEYSRVESRTRIIAAPTATGCTLPIRQTSSSHDRLEAGLSAGGASIRTSTTTHIKRVSVRVKR